MSFWSWFKPKAKYRPTTVRDLVDHFAGDIIKISQWIGDNVWYYRDTKPEHSWQRAEVTLARLKGDCEDFATLYSKIFQILGWEHRLYCGYKRKTGHAICVALTPRGYTYTSNDLFILTHKDGWIEVVKEAMPGCAVYRRVDCIGMTMETF
jgi:hypothetical protein